MRRRGVQRWQLNFSTLNHLLDKKSELSERYTNFELGSAPDLTWALAQTWPRSGRDPALIRRPGQIESEVADSVEIPN